jgi:hypothetical protein
MFKFLFSITFTIFLIQVSNSQTIIFSEDFEDFNSLSNWKIVNEDGFTPASDVSEYIDAWILTIDPSDSSDTVVSATSYFINPERANRWLISPAITLGDFGNFVSWNAKSFDPSFPEDYKVLYSTTGNNIEDFNDTLALFISENYIWNTYDFSLSDKNLDNQEIYLAFVLTTYDANRLYIDDITVRKEDPLSLKENSYSKNLIYPNPTLGILNIPHDLNQNIIIKSIEGKMVLNQQINKNTVDLEYLKSGYYIVEYFMNGIEYKEKFFKN